jgi:hypothetical protein
MRGEKDAPPAATPLALGVAGQQSSVKGTSRTHYSLVNPASVSQSVGRSFRAGHGHHRNGSQLDGERRLVRAKAGRRQTALLPCRHR